MDVSLPHNGWLPRSHQLGLWQHLQGGGKRAMAVWHRRAGKDEVALHHTAVQMMKRPGNYWHALPEYTQGRKALWSAINAHTGRRRIDEAFPMEMRESTNDTEMFIRFKQALGGSTWQVMGSDRYDATLGSGVAGIVYSEWALANPSAWAYHRPILEENNGWAVFITTPRGHNHCKSMFDYAMRSREWYCELLTARDTGALNEAQLTEAREEMMALYGDDAGRATYEQEYECSWNAAILGSFFSSEMAQVRREERITDKCEALEGVPVNRAWDLGVRDDTTIWFYQDGPQIRILDCYSQSGAGVEHYAGIIESKLKQYGWKNGVDHVPHDAKVREFGTGRTRVETMASMGLKPMLVPAASIADGINAVRRVLPLCVFHTRCEEGINALEQYRREWDDEKKTFRALAVHDWTSHYADSFRYLSMAVLPITEHARRRATEQRRENPLGDGFWRIPPPVENRQRGIIL